MTRFVFFAASFFGVTGVGLGAFAAHGLRQQLSASMLSVFQTGVLYQLLHTVALVGLAVACTVYQSVWLRAASGFMMAGILLFSGSLYLLVLTPLNLGLVTPLGGLLFMLGWLSVGVGGYSLTMNKTH